MIEINKCWAALRQIGLARPYQRDHNACRNGSSIARYLLIKNGLYSFLAIQDSREITSANPDLLLIVIGERDPLSR